MRRRERKRASFRPRRNILWLCLAAAFTALALFAVLDASYRLRDRPSVRLAYRQPGDDPADRRRVKDAIRFRIGQLLRPDEDFAAISGDRTGRLIEIGYLYGRLALMEEQEGDIVGRDRHMADALRFLRDAGIRNADGADVRATIAKQNRNP
jgi:hypothetical protein